MNTLRLDALRATLEARHAEDGGFVGQFRRTSAETKPRGGRPSNPLITQLVEREGVSRATAFRRRKAKREAQLAKAARLGNGTDPANRHPEDFYLTPPRGTRALLETEQFTGVIWEPACGNGAISRVLEAAGHTVISTDLIDRGYGRRGWDFLEDHTTVADHIITNPPFKLSQKFVEHALARVRPGGKICMLLPLNWVAAQSRRHLTAKCARKWVFTKRLEAHRGDYTGKQAAPQVNLAWYVFTNEHDGPIDETAMPPDAGCGGNAISELRSDGAGEGAESPPRDEAG